MISYRLLSAADFRSLYECFLAAFSDYQVDMRMSQEEFAHRLARDGVRVEISAGAFNDSRLIAFYMNGFGLWRGQQTVYDSGTGVIPSHRGKGIAKELFAFMIPQLKECVASQYLLEVLSSNQPARSLYRKLGFIDTRKLVVFRAKAPLKLVGGLPRVSIRSVEHPDWRLFESFWDGYPSWQNSIDAVERIVKERIVVGAYVDGTCVGYGIVFRPSGNLMQLAVAHAHRRRGIGSRILQALSSGESLKVNNIDEELEGALAFYKANGFKAVLEQYEMKKDL
jgi:ribosomal protein S18 acetylase RimI-like enzyme